jgi:hypothetical protein
MMQRDKFIDRYFINLSLEKDHLDIYYVRKSILRALESNLSRFKGIVLDVGCGIMPYRELILERNKNVTSYVGLDYENSLDPEYAMGKPDLFWKGDIIPVNDNTADVIIATELFEFLFYTVPFLWNLHLIPYDEYRYTPFSLKRHLMNAGFMNIEMRALGGLDASLAQMMGIWYNNRPLKASHKKYLGSIFIALINRLIKADAKVDKATLFTEGSMITGITGTASKAEHVSPL